MQVKDKNNFFFLNQI